MPKITPLKEDELEAICDVLGDTSDGLSGSQIGQLLSQWGIEDPNPDIIRRHRLYQALSLRQYRDGSANHILAFVQSAISPARYADRPEHFELLRKRLNETLVYAGFQVGEDGKFRKVSPRPRRSEADLRADRLRSALLARGAHPEVLQLCRPEYLSDHAYDILERSSARLSKKLQDKSGLEMQGEALIEEIFSLDSGPRLVINTLQTKGERREHAHLVELIKFLMAAFTENNAWKVGETDALDYLSLFSLVYRQIDRAVLTGN